MKIQEEKIHSGTFKRSKEESFQTNLPRNIPQSPHLMRLGSQPGCVLGSRSVTSFYAAFQPIHPVLVPSLPNDQKYLISHEVLKHILFCLLAFPISSVALRF